MKKIILILILFTYGCAAPQIVKEKASSILSPVCYDLFTDSGLLRYQNLAHQFRGKAVFAYGKDNAGSVCAYASISEAPDLYSLFDPPKWSTIETLALGKCEAKRKEGGLVNSPCKVFARNNEIVWGTSLDNGLQ
jgi:hypothetical protein